MLQTGIHCERGINQTGAWELQRKLVMHPYCLQGKSVYNSDMTEFWL